MNFKTTYSNTPENLKLKFLDAVILENEKLQQAFLNYTGQESKTVAGISHSKFLKIIKSTQDSCLRSFEQVDPENPDWDSYNPPHSGYIEEWEQYQQASEQEFEQIFEDFRAEAVDKIIGQQVDELIAMLIGLYEATQDAVIVDEVGSFDDVNKLLLAYHKDLTDELITKINLSAISDGNITSTFQLFAEYADEEYPGNNFFPGYFEGFLKALACKSNNAEGLLTIIDNSKIERATLPGLILMLNKNAGKAEEWLHHAQKFYLANKEVAEELLAYFFKTEINAFLKTAHELFTMDKRHWAEFLKEFVTVDLDKSLFLTVFYELTIKNREIKYYLKIKDYLNSDDFDKLLEELDYHITFIVEILEVEERYDDIRQIVEQNPDSWDYIELITPILDIYPEFCFQHIKNKAVKTIDTKRGRSAYERVVSWLKLADKIPGYKAENRILAHQLYNHKPNLPALRDELRKGGVV
nr:hypothetical protein [Bacteroidota bacterium]